MPGPPCKTQRSGSDVASSLRASSSSSATRSATFAQNARCSGLQVAWLARLAAHDRTAGSVAPVVAATEPTTVVPPSPLGPGD